MEDNQKGFTWKHIFAHTLIIIAISAVVIYVISRDVYASVSDYISGVGSAASVYAIAITLWQLRQVKRVAQAAKDAALQKTEEIESFLTYADIERHIEMCNSIYSCINGEQYEAAAMKLDEMRHLLIEKRERCIGSVDVATINKVISDIGNDSVNLRNRWISNGELDNKVVFKHINKLSNVLSDIAANIKMYNYDREVPANCSNVARPN